MSQNITKRIEQGFYALFLPLKYVKFSDTSTKFVVFKKSQLA